jgi:hypothetical protein
VKYRILFIKRGGCDPHFEVQYRKWFRWHTVMDWHDRLPFRVPVQWQRQEDAEKYIERQSKTVVVVSQKTVYTAFHDYHDEIRVEKLKKDLESNLTI